MKKCFFHSLLGALFVNHSFHKAIELKHFRYYKKKKMPYPNATNTPCLIAINISMNIHLIPTLICEALIYPDELSFLGVSFTLVPSYGNTSLNLFLGVLSGSLATRHSYSTIFLGVSSNSLKTRFSESFASSSFLCNNNKYYQ